MKWFCIVLLVLNVLYLGWEYRRELERTIVEPRPQTVFGAEPLKLLSELERLPSPRVEKASAGPKMKRAAKQSPAQQKQLAPENEKPVVAALAELPDCKTPAAADSSAQSAPNRLRCHVIGPFLSAQTALDYGSLLNKHGALAAPREQECKEDLGRFWIYLPPGRAPDWLSKQLADLRQKGIEDFMAIRSGPMKDVISLGVYSTEKLAQRRLEQLRAEGVRPTLSPHYQVREKYWLDVKLAAPKLPAKLPAGAGAHQIECKNIAVAEAIP
ncbi:MAG: SPOR domain-containing protein [Gammaproteobacteria bacterium]